MTYQQCQHILIGKIVKTWGIKGGLKIHCFTNKALDITEFRNIFDATGRGYNIKVIKTQKQLAMVLIDGISSCDQAEALIGTELFISRSTLPDIAENEFYYHDLIGMKVYLESLEVTIGFVRNVMNFGASDIIEIEKVSEENYKSNSQESSTLLYPFSNDFILEINLIKKYLIIKLIEEI